MTHASVTPGMPGKMGITPDLLRISVGITVLTGHPHVALP
jgi:cystathionine beta-lyase/cystathionine gamma-synthase